MSRFAYIPLNFDNITLGIERELSIKRDTKDLYVLDDYKVPVSATANIRELFEKNDIVAHNVLNDTIQLEIRHKSYIKQISNLGYEIDKLVESFSNETANRVEALSTYQKYLRTRFTQIYDTYNKLKSELEVTFNSYCENLQDLLEMIKFRYNDASDKLKVYNTYYNSYEAMITSMEYDNQQLFDALETKLTVLGNGAGTFSGSKTVIKTKSVRFITMFRWLSNNTSTYPGHDYAWYSYSTPPDDPNNFGAGKIDVEDGESTWSNWVIEWDSSVFSSLIDAVYYFHGTPLNSLWWNGDVYNNNGAGWISETGRFNQWGRQVYLCYYKNKEITTTQNFYYNVT